MNQTALPAAPASPRISVITANFNQSRWLAGCLESIHGQHYPNLEHIVIDGASTDGSVDIIRRYADRLAYWCSERDAGQYDALNKGFAKSTGEIMAFLNADDIYCPWTLRTVASVFEALPEVEWMASTMVAQVNAEGACVGTGQVVPSSRNAFLDGFYVPGAADAIGCIVQEGVFWRRSLWDRAKAQLNLARGLAADFDLWCQFYRHAEPYGLNVPLAAMTRHAQQRSNDNAGYQQECQASLKVLRAGLGYTPRSLGVKRLLLRLPVGRSLVWRGAKRVFDYTVKVVDSKSDASGYHAGWVTKSFRLIL
jgi:hypothetical protein